MPKQITDYILYRWRFGIGYALVGLLVGILLVFAAAYVPGGLSKSEISTAITSNQLTFDLDSFNPSSVVDLPYKLLQYGSFAIFGITAFSVKLPSLLLGILSVVGVVLLLRYWFHQNVAVISALIVITASQFIFASQDGTPTVMYIFLPTWLLLLALKVSRHIGRKSFWELLLMAALALSLYTPLSIYILLALISATLLHPHLRFIVGRLSRQKLIIAGLIGLALLAPLIASIIMEPSVGLTLLGIPNSQPDLVANGTKLARDYFDFISSGAGDEFRPIYTLPSLLLVALGLTRLFTTKYTARSYIIISWIVLLTPIILINPEKTTIAFVPVMLLIASGIDVLLHRWYRLFPRNPYARVAGLLPITLLVAGMAFTGLERYFYVYHYNPSAAASFSDDLSLLNRELTKTTSSEKPVTLLVTESELPFYQAVAEHRSNMRVIPPGQAEPKNQPVIASRGAYYDRGLGEPTRIITNASSSEADRLYLYKTEQQ